MELQHVHLTVNAKVEPHFKELPKADAQRFVDKLMEGINMTPLGPMQWAEAEDLEFPGQSFVQMITTSHCSLHFFSETSEIYFDLYSCTVFDEEKVVKLLDDTFRLSEWHGMIYTRATGGTPEVRKIGSQKKEELTLRITD
jgi:S-adenosylmethionine/arginine decarboxylase-like enzyme